MQQKNNKDFIEAKIQEIEHALANAQVIDVKDIPETGRVVFGATIDLYDLTNDQSITYKIVGNLESDPEAGLISIQTPIAQGLMGKNVGDEVSISTPSGPMILKLKKYNICNIYACRFMGFKSKKSWSSFSSSI